METDLSLKIHAAKSLNPRLGYRKIAVMLGCSKSLVKYYLDSTSKRKNANRQAINRKRNLLSLKITFGGKCTICGYSKCLSALDFHHTDPSSKTGCVSALIRNSKSKAISEARKCVLLCRNCHTEVHEGLVSTT